MPWRVVRAVGLCGRLHRFPDPCGCSRPRACAECTCLRPPPGDTQLANAEEYIDSNFAGNLGEILIRCNNVLYIRGVPEDGEEA